MSQLAVVVPAPVRAVLARFGEVGRIRSTVGGFSNTTFATTIDGHPVVVKANSLDTKRADLRREIDVLRYLANSDIPVPLLRGFGEDDGDEWTVLVLDAIEAEPGLNVVQRGDIDELIAAAREFGKLLAVVHDQPISPVDVPDRPGNDLAQRWADARRSVEGPESNLSFAHPATRVGVALVHGDAGFHNTLWNDGKLVSLIDWELAGHGNPLADLGWAWWSMTFRRLPVDVFEGLIEGYRRERAELLGWSDDAVREVVRAQMFALLDRTAPDSGARKEWLRRMEGLGRLSVPEL